MLYCESGPCGDFKWTTEGPPVDFLWRNIVTGIKEFILYSFNYSNLQSLKFEKKGRKTSLSC